MRQEIQDLINQLVLKIERLEKENGELRQVAGLAPEDKPEFWKFRHAYPFTIPVIDMDTSTRTVNCLKSMDINTRATIVSYRLKRAKIESRAFFRQTVLAHQRVSRFNHDLCFVITNRGPLQGPQVKRIARPTEVFTSEWKGVVLVRDGVVYGYND